MTTVTFICWIGLLIINVVGYFHGYIPIILIVMLIIITILLLRFGKDINDRKRTKKVLTIDEDGIMLYNWYDKSIYRFKWYQIKKVVVTSNAPIDHNWGLLVYTHDKELLFCFSPYYSQFKPKKCIEVLKDCVDVDAKLKIK